MTVRVHGDLDDENLFYFNSVLNAAAADDVSEFNVDLTDCDYLNSAILSLLIRLARKYPGDFHITVRPSGCVTTIFDVSGLMAAGSFVRVADDGTTNRERRAATE